MTMEWLLQDIHNIWLNREIWVMYGGLITVGVTIFLMGVLKKLFGDKIQNKLVRKTVLAFFSVVLVAPITATYLIFNTASGIDYFWYMYALNAIGTIVVYWFYENTHLRELLALIGRNTIMKVFTAIFKKDKDTTVQNVTSSIRDDAKKIVKSVKYEDDDLKNL
jgi:hypothetical protein